MSGPFFGHFRLNLIDSTKVISLKNGESGSMDIVELHGDILQPRGQLETPGLVLINLQSMLSFYQLQVQEKDFSQWLCWL